jgi:hypothetical protein
VNKAKKWKSRGSTPRHKARERDALLSLSLSLSLSRPKQTDEQGLRAIVHQSRGVRLRCYDPFDGEAVSPWLGLFSQSLEARL